MNKVRKILLLMAMHDEAAPCISKFSLIFKGLLHPKLDFELYQGIFNDAEISLVLNGKCKVYGVDHIGPQVSTLSAHLGIDLINPDLIVNAGTAGGFKSDNARIGDVYLSYPEICYHDRRINLPGFFEYGVGKFKCTISKQITEDLNLKKGVVSTGSSLDFTSKDLEIISNNKGVVKDMEAAAIAWVAELHSIPFVAIKAITDIVDGEIPTEDEFIQNLHFSSKRLCEETSKLIEWFTKNGTPE